MGDSRSWWRLVSVTFLLLLILVLFMLAREAVELRGRVLSRLRTSLWEKSSSLPRKERLELQGALTCLELSGETTSKSAEKLGAFIRLAQVALGDAQLTAEEARTLAQAAREACASGAP